MTVLPDHVEQPKTLDYMKLIKRVCAYAMLAMLGAYAVQLLNSASNVGLQEKNLIIVAFTLTLLLAIPMIALNIYFVSRHRASSTSAKYSSRGSFSIKKELVAWAFPVAIVGVLAFLGWGTTHSLDLYKPIESKVAPERVATVTVG